MPFYWNPDIPGYEYQDTGEIVPEQQIREDSNKSIATAMTAAAVTIGGVLSAGVGTLANLQSAGLLSPEDFNELFRAEIKREYIRQYTLGIGGVENMTPSDWGSLGGMIAEQYRFLPDFIDAIASGDLSEAQIRNRAGMYINSSREAFERANEKVQIEAGFDEVLWVMDIPAEHCPDCKAFADMGWQKIEDDPYNGCRPGQACTQCLCITTPHSRVLTIEGWKTLADVKVGDLVLTHRRRWKPVTGILIKPSLPGEQEVFITTPEGNKIGCTSGHLWHTPIGWLNSIDIDSSLTPMYHVPIKIQGVNYDTEEMRKVRLSFGANFKEDYVQILSIGMSLWEQEGFQSSCLPELFTQREGKAAMEKQERVNSFWNPQSWREKTHKIGRLVQENLAGAIRWQKMELVLAGWGKQKENNIPLSVGMDNEQRANTTELRHPSQGWEQLKRFIRQFRIDENRRARQASRSDNTQECCRKYARMDLPESRMQKEIQSISETQRWNPQILFKGVLRPKTAIYDLTVKDDHSFVIEGLIAHNSNCRCHLEYRKSGEV